MPSRVVHVLPMELNCICAGLRYCTGFMPPTGGLTRADSSLRRITANVSHAKKGRARACKRHEGISVLLKQWDIIGWVLMTTMMAVSACQLQRALRTLVTCRSFKISRNVSYARLLVPPYPAKRAIQTISSRRCLPGLISKEPPTITFLQSRRKLAEEKTATNT